MLVILDVSTTPTTSASAHNYLAKGKMQPPNIASLALKQHIMLQMESRGAAHMRLPRGCGDSGATDHASDRLGDGSSAAVLDTGSRRDSEAVVAERSRRGGRRDSLTAVPYDCWSLSQRPK